MDGVWMRERWMDEGMEGRWKERDKWMDEKSKRKKGRKGKGRKWMDERKRDG